MSVAQQRRPVIRLDDLDTDAAFANLSVVSNGQIPNSPHDSVPTSPSRLSAAWRRRLPMRLSVAGKRKSAARLTPPLEDSRLTPVAPNLEPPSGYEEWRINPQAKKSNYRLSDEERKRLEAGYEWEHESVGSADEDDVADSYSWVDPDKAGSALGRTPGASSSSLEDETPRPEDRQEPRQTPQPRPVRTPLNIVTQSSKPTHQPTPRVPISPSPQAAQQRATQPDPQASYNRLLSFQTSSSLGHSSSQSSHENPLSPTTGRPQNRSGPEWHEVVEPAVFESLDRTEVRRQGLWWELIKGELEYTADLKTACEFFMSPLISHDPHIIDPEPRLAAFANEVFSTLPQIAEKHNAMSNALMQRQRDEWPFITTASDVLLHAFLDLVTDYETYMKNYPFAEARVRRERQKNKLFASFLAERQDSLESRRRDLFAFLVRPVTRLPRLLLLLDALIACTPADHPDREILPTVHQVLTGTLKGSQPGIESAEAKIKLWNVAERLLFRKGEIIELDIGEPKRSLAHEGYVFRRVRSETNWHGWQDLHAFLLDNYFLLARDEEHGKFVVVSRPIHLDFLNLVSIDAVPERRYDYLSPRRRGETGAEPQRTERLMFPMTISTGSGLNGRTYTLCTSTQAAREQWKEKIEAAQTLRQFDVENNRLFAIHRLSSPLVRERLTTADSFEWIGRDVVAAATIRSVWLGWKRDSGSFRELITFPTGHISTISFVPQFGWLLVVSSGRLYLFSLTKMIPTSEPSTWTPLSKDDATVLSPPEHNVAFARVGDTKGRILIAYAAHARNSHQSLISLHEPLLPSHSIADVHFRQYATLNIPGYASDIFFFRQTVAVVTERSFVIAEPGNSATHAIPTFPTSIPAHATVVRLATAAKPLAMYQIAEDEFVLVYDWGACFVNMFGEVGRKGSFFRWNINPSYCVFRAPHVILFDEAQGLAEVRDIMTGRMCEVIEEKGLRPIRLARRDQDLQCLSSKGLMQIKETFEL